jgi:hypothetical protein
MVTYPISVHRDGYRGRDAGKKMKAARHNMNAQALEQAANELLRAQKEPIQSYLWHELSKASGLDIDTVRSLGFSIDGGHNGYTAIRPGLTFEEANRLLHDPSLE